MKVLVANLGSTSFKYRLFDPGSGYGAVGEFHYVHHQPDGSPYEDPAEMAIAVLWIAPSSVRS